MKLLRAKQLGRNIQGIRRSDEDGSLVRHFEPYVSEHTLANRFPGLSYPSFHPNSSAINTERRSWSTGMWPVRAGPARQMEHRKIFRGFPEWPGSNFTCIKATFRRMLSPRYSVGGSVRPENQNGVYFRARNFPGPVWRTHGKLLRQLFLCTMRSYSKAGTVLLEQR